MKMKPNRQSTAYFVACLFILTASAGFAQGVCPEFREQTEQQLPREVGDPALVERLLSPDISQPQLSEAFDVHRLERTVRDRLTADKDCCGSKDDPHSGEGEQRYTGRQESTLRTDLERGKIVYLSRKRSHDPLSGEENKVPEDRAVETVLETAKLIGLPPEELDRRNLETRVLMAAGRDQKNAQRAVRLRAEVHVRIPRVVGKTPVFDSYMTTAIDASGRVARLHVQWPDFALAEGLSPERALKREAVQESIVEYLAESHLCGTLSKLVAAVAYVQTGELAISNTDDEGEKEREESTNRFVPALVVYAIPVEPKEDSGEISMGAQQFVVPLVATAGDRG